MDDKSMVRTYLLLLILLSPHTLLAEDEDIEWLSWPVTGHPYTGEDPGILIPSAQTRFFTTVRRDVVIGLRSDGTVVWKKLKSKNRSNAPINDDELKH
jgi:hypothetical protein